MDNAEVIAGLEGLVMSLDHILDELDLMASDPEVKARAHERFRAWLDA